MKTTKRLISIACFCLFMASLSASTRYSTYLNGFDGFHDANIANNCLIIDNPFATSKTALFEASLGTNYKIVARIANLNNDGKKSHKVTNADNSQSKVKNSAWGIVFNFYDEANYNAILFQCDDTAEDDIIGARRLHCKIVEVKNNIERCVYNHYLEGDVNRYTGNNLVSIEAKNNKVMFGIGMDKPKLITEVTDMELSADRKAGILAGKASKVSVERFIIKTDNSDHAILQTKWTVESLKEHFCKTNDPYEGFWRYLDRDMDENLLKMGGRYTIALVKADNGYDIIYVDGAKVMSSKWQPGMKKGTLKRTTFQDDYDLVWYDSNLLPFTLDVSASIENASIITFKFPIQKSQIRFSRMQE